MKCQAFSIGRWGLLADRINRASQFGSKDRLPGAGDAQDKAPDQPEAPRQLEGPYADITRRDRRGADLDEDFVVAGHRFWPVCRPRPDISQVNSLNPAPTTSPAPAATAAHSAWPVFRHASRR